MTWSSLGSMSTHRHGLGVVVLEGPLYAIGGHDGKNVDCTSIDSNYQFFFIFSPHDTKNVGWSYLNTVER